jgi:hypothetical protein
MLSALRQNKLDGRLPSAYLVGQEEFPAATNDDIDDFPLFFSCSSELLDTMAFRFGIDLSFISFLLQA